MKNIFHLTTGLTCQCNAGFQDCRTARQGMCPTLEPLIFQGSQPYATKGRAYGNVHLPHRVRRQISGECSWGRSGEGASNSCPCSRPISEQLSSAALRGVGVFSDPVCDIFNSESKGVANNIRGRLLLLRSFNIKENEIWFFF